MATTQGQYTVIVLCASSADATVVAGKLPGATASGTTVTFTPPSTYRVDVAGDGSPLSGVAEAVRQLVTASTITGPVTVYRRSREEVVIS